jgi:hypothetical protein
MDLWPSIGDINISVMAWNTDGNYYKKWAETGSEAGITAEHIIGNLAASANYTVKVDGAEFGSYQSDSSGLISFTYDGGYSEKIFEVQDTTAPTTISNDYNSGWNTIDQNIQFSCSDPASGCKNFYYAIDDANYQQAWDSDNNIGIAITIDGNHSIFYWSSDNADNNETAHITYAALDKDEPTITITSPPNGHTQKSTTITLHYTATDTNSGIAKYYIKADTGSWIDNNTNTSYAFTGQSTTTHTYQAKAVNNAGNEATATITTTIEPTNNTASGTPGGNTGTPTPTGTTTLFETETTATPSQQEIQATLSEAGFTQEQINAAMQIAQKTPTTQTATGMKTISMSGTAYRTSITITITNNSANKWREIKVIAEIPKNIAESTAPIDSNNTFSVLKEDPIIQFALPEIQTGETAEIEYTIAKNISETEAKTLPQPIIASYQETQPCDNVECENTPCATGKCNNTTGKCEYEYAADGTNCGLNKTCQSGTCLQTQQPPSGPGTQEPPAQQVEPDYIAPAMAAAAAILIIAAAGYYFARKRK